MLTAIVWCLAMAAYGMYDMLIPVSAYEYHPAGRIIILICGLAIPAAAILATIVINKSM